MDKGKAKDSGRDRLDKDMGGRDRDRNSGKGSLVRDRGRDWGRYRDVRGRGKSRRVGVRILCLVDFITGTRHASSLPSKSKGMAKS